MNNFETMKKTLIEAGLDVSQMSVFEFENKFKELASIERKKEIDSVPLNKKIQYFLCWDKFVKFFGEELSREALSQIDFKDIANEKGYIHENYPQSCGYDHIRDGYGYVEIAHKRASSYHKTERKLLHYYYVPSPYQHLKHEQMIKYILNKLYPSLLKDLKVTVYSIDNGNGLEEMYIKMGKKTLYVPLKAFMEKDIEAIKERNISYQNSYYHDDKYCDDIFTHPDFARFCTILNG